MMIAADDRDRRGDEQRARHQHEHLHLLHVVGDARDQRRRAELADLLRRELGDAVEQAAAHVAAEPHRRARPEVHGADRERDLDERDRRASAAPMRQM